MRGKLISYSQRHRNGRIRPDGGGKSLSVNADDIAGSMEPPPLHGAPVEYEVWVDPATGPRAVNVRLLPEITAEALSLEEPGGEEHTFMSEAAGTPDCFVVMPYGRSPQEVRWFAGWYELVISVAVREAGYEPVLAAAQDKPAAINDEVRWHLARDPMVVVDIGGVSVDSDPNPNVMYELGIRHAFNLPHVIMAWEGQRLPFDIGNQRVLMESRDLIDVPVNRTRLKAFISQATSGNYYRPMDAVERVATLELAERRLGASSVLGALVEEVRELRSRLPAIGVVLPSPTISLREAIGASGSDRRALFEQFQALGGTGQQWGRLCAKRVDPKLVRVKDKLGLVLAVAKAEGLTLRAPGTALVLPDSSDGQD